MTIEKREESKLKIVHHVRLFDYHCRDRSINKFIV